MGGSRVDGPEREVEYVMCVKVGSEEGCEGGEEGGVGMKRSGELQGENAVKLSVEGLK